MEQMHRWATGVSNGRGQALYLERVPVRSFVSYPRASTSAARKDVSGLDQVYTRDETEARVLMSVVKARHGAPISHG